MLACKYRSGGGGMNSLFTMIGRESLGVGI